MPRVAGRFARLYVALSSAGTAEPVNFINDFTVDQLTATFDVTAIGDTSHVYVAGLPDAKGTYKGWLDTTSSQLFLAAADGQARKFYMYSNITDGAGGTASAYWVGTAFFDAQSHMAVNGGTDISGNWSAATPVARVN